MYLIVGLGNIGKEYDKTRHNIGFDVIEEISKEYNIELNRQKFKGTYGEGRVDGKKIILLKPSTYMNLSGESIREVVDFYKIDKKNIIVIYDDMSLEIGRLRVRGQGSAGGHNGIKSIISHLGTEAFSRIKVGIGHPTDNIVQFVLGKFNKEERVIVDKSVKVAGETAINFIKYGLNDTMNKFNATKIEI